MKLKLVYERSSGRSADIVVTVDPAALVGEVADGIARVDPTFQGGPAEGLTLSVSPPGRAEFTTLEASRPVGVTKFTAPPSAFAP